MSAVRSQLRARATWRALAPLVRSGLARRIAILVAELEPTRPGRGGLAQLAALLPGLSSSQLWLVLSVFSGRFPRPTEVRRLRRQLELDGGWDAIDTLLHELPHRYDPRFRPAPVVFERNVPSVDVTGLIEAGVNSEGRGAGRRLLRDWARARAFRPVLWAADGRWLRGLTPDEAESLGLSATHAAPAHSMIVPVGGYILLGTVDLPKGAERLIGLGQYSGIATASVGYGIGPLVHSENYAKTDGAERFTWHLAAQRSFSRLVAVGVGADIQYHGWKRMLSAVGIDGPDVVPLELPSTSADDAWSHFSDECASALGIA